MGVVLLRLMSLIRLLDPYSVPILKHVIVKEGTAKQSPFLTK